MFSGGKHTIPSTRAHLFENVQVDTVHSGATSWSLNVVSEAYENSDLSETGHVNPKDVKMLIIWRKSTPMPSADMFTRLTCANTPSAMKKAAKCGRNR